MSWVSSAGGTLVAGKPSGPELVTMAVKSSPKNQPSWCGKVHKTPTTRTGRSSAPSRNKRSRSPSFKGTSRAASSTIRGASEQSFDQRWTVSFRTAVITAITVAVLMSCTGMYVPLEVFTRVIRLKTEQSCHKAVREQRGLIDSLVTYNVTAESYTRLLGTVSTMVRRYVQSPPDEALDSLSSTMLTWQKFNTSWTGRTARERRQLKYADWTILSSQWSSDRRVYDDVSDTTEFGAQWRRPHADWLYVSFEDEALAGLALDKDAFAVNDVNASDVGTSLASLYLDVPGTRPGVESQMTYSYVNPTTGDAEGVKEVIPYLASGRPFYKVQQSLLEAAENSPGGAESVLAERAWSGIYNFVDEDFGFSWTAPVAYCGNYSCFEGVMAADITLKYVSLDCTVRWRDLRRLLASEAFNRFYIGAENSSVFIVNHVSERARDQQGLLVGAAHGDLSVDKGLVMATDSVHDIVRATSKALFEKFHSWDAPELRENQLITYRKDKIESGVFVPCEPKSLTETSLEDVQCMQVGTMSVELDRGTRWLLVAVLPTGAFSKEAVHTARRVDAALVNISTKSKDFVNQARAAGLGIFFGMTVLSVCLGFALGFLVSMPLRKLSKLMRRLGDLDFAHGNKEFADLRQGQRSRIRDVSKLQRTFCSLSVGIEAFARFVPETVVRNIVRGDQRATRLHVSRKQVTIMFSDIRDFTSLSENMTQKDLLFVLTRYFTVMTRIVELFEGVVAEILGDGLLIYWNTPHKVEDHAGKACAAALAQQQALHLLNQELARLGLPQLAIRIGLHTGAALSGNIGSDMKMKFGCLGDPVNLAGKLESLCKHYGVGILCSGATYEALPPDAGFFCRRLDMIQVGGKAEAVSIYEVIGRQQQSSDEGYASPSTRHDGGLTSTQGAAAPPRTDSEEDLEAGVLQRAGSRRSSRPSVRASRTSDAMGTPSTPPAAAADGDQPRSTPLQRAASGLSSIYQEPVNRIARQCIRGSMTPSTYEASQSPAVLPDGTTSAALPDDSLASPGLPQDGISSEQRRRVVQYEVALTEFQKANFQEAIMLAEQLAKEDPHDVAAALLCERARTHAGLSEEELVNWTGVQTLDK